MILVQPITWIMHALAAVSIAILNLAAWITGLAGIILNYSVWYTVANMKILLEQGNVINDAWTTFRDVANMLFIFVLLYAAIKTILGMGDDTQKLIRNVIIVAILINFSLFFTKLVIDASNILAITFYDAVAPGSLALGAGGFNSGLSSHLMQALGLQGIWTSPLEFKGDPEQLLIVGIMGTILCLVAAFVFFAIAIMLVIRFVVLIFVLILSPLAFMGSVLPELKSRVTNKWTEALLGQAFFAPIYFLLAWVVVKVSQGILGSIAPAGSTAALANTFLAQQQTQTTVGLILNFIIVIALLIASLIIAKDWANKAGGAVSGMTKWALGAAGGATLGGAAWASRNTLGRVGTAVSESETLKKARQWSDKRGGALGFVGGVTTRGVMTGGKKLGGASYDIRGTGLGGTLEAGKPGGKGGFTQYRKDVAKSEEEFAKSLAPSDKVKAKAEAARQEAVENMKKYEGAHKEAVERHGADSIEALRAEKTLGTARLAKIEGDQMLGNKKEVDEKVKKIEEEKKKAADKVREKHSESIRTADLEEKSALDNVNKLKIDADAAIGTAREDAAKVALKSAQENLDKARTAGKEIRRVASDEARAINENFDTEIKNIKSTEIKSSGDVRKEAFAQATERSIWGKIRGYNYAAAAQIRKGKTAQQEAADALKKLAKETGVEGAEEKTEEKPEGGESGGGEPKPT
jgi:hypothetical protein